ncbi:MAG: hypothetical protein PHD07_03190 [Bacteroidales bacterium]|nr:hypothetical protein [Bacteroidales bacterium]MDD3201909.1 hypothetical protein [Bacteroidales bacterium]
MLENLVAINLLRIYGRDDAVFFYKKGVEVDFVIPETATAIQVCYNLDNSDGTLDRDVSALIKLSKVVECKKLMIITRDQKQTIEESGKTIEVIPVWEWLLNIK